MEQGRPRAVRTRATAWSREPSGCRIDDVPPRRSSASRAHPSMRSPMHLPAFRSSGQVRSVRAAVGNHQLQRAWRALDSSSRRAGRGARGSSHTPTRVPPWLGPLSRQGRRLRPTGAPARRSRPRHDAWRACSTVGLEQARLVNQHRRCSATPGTYHGQPVSVQTSGMGTPSLSIMVEELLRLGARRLIRMGTTRRHRYGLRTGDLVVATSAAAVDGATRTYLHGDPFAPAADFELTRALVDTARARASSHPWARSPRSTSSTTPTTTT